MADELHFVDPEAADWQAFLRVARREGWRIPATELELYRGSLAGSALALRCGDRFAGMVTAVNHGKSAWIGNLIVPPALRGRGYGKLLLDRAILNLEQQQARSIWLTASETGFPLYRRRGFDTLGQVERWVLSGGGASSGPAAVPSEGHIALQAADAAVWGETRPLLDSLLCRGRVLACGGSVALLQQEPGLQILGPWVVSDASREKELIRLLAMAVATANPDEELVVDVRSGAVSSEFLQAFGFDLCGNSRLMARGDVSGVELTQLVAFASLGSMG